MSTKAQIQTNIDNKVDETALGRLILDSDLREVMADDTASFLENIYPTPINDTETAETLTTSNANYDYDVYFTKTGRKVHITGVLTVNTTQNIASTVFAISDAEYQQLSGVTFRGQGVFQPSTDTATIGILSNNLIINDAVIAGETITFEITYEVNA